MNWFGWLLVAYWGVSAVATIAMVGKQRTPTTPFDAVFIVLVQAAFIVGMLTVGVQ